MLLLLLRGKGETPVIENLESVIRDSSIQTLRLPTNIQFRKAHAFVNMNCRCIDALSILH